jgi:signal transduction histidine kinase
MIGDEWVLRQILVNLLDIALKLTNEKGVVSLQVRGDLDQQRIIFSVECSGSVIARADLAHLFEPFSRPNNTQVHPYDGAGLRLALVQHMVQLHHGSITARTEPGQALTFLMTLPWSKPAEKIKPS